MVGVLLLGTVSHNTTFALLSYLCWGFIFVSIRRYARRYHTHQKNRQMLRVTKWIVLIIGARLLFLIAHALW